VGQQPLMAFAVRLNTPAPAITSPRLDPKRSRLLSPGKRPAASCPPSRCCRGPPRRLAPRPPAPAAWVAPIHRAFQGDGVSFAALPLARTAFAAHLPRPPAARRQIAAWPASPTPALTAASPPSGCTSSTALTPPGAVPRVEANAERRPSGSAVASVHSSAVAARLRTRPHTAVSATATATASRYPAPPVPQLGYLA
jgi:hypothetical protein